MNTEVASDVFFEGYDFSSPKKEWVLPEKLDEISGLVYLNKSKIACVNDEQGSIYVYDLESETITNKIKFSSGGDYEGITYRAPHYFVIRSDGKLFRFNEKKEKLKTYDLPFTEKNNIEGLCLESDSTLLLALKGVGGKHGEKKKYKAIYRYNLNSNKTKIAYKLEFDHRVGFSGVTLNSEKDKIYILSHKSKELISIDRSTGNIEDVLSLDPNLFPQPEGICISKEGRLFISNERTEFKNARLLEF